LLERSRQNLALRDRVAAVLGRRGRWLAGQNAKAWGRILRSAEIDDADLDRAWTEGTAAERIAAFRPMRQADPAGARAKLEAAWKTEGADQRASLVEALADGLSMDDEPALEGWLDDRSKQVRKAASELLAGLPESRFAGRMAERVKACCTPSPKPGIEPPGACDAGMQRDGIEAKTGGLGLGDRAWWLYRIAALAPLGAWTEALGMDGPEKLIVRATFSDWIEALQQGWSEAAIRQRDTDWAEALLGSITKKNWRILQGAGALLDVLPAERRNALVADQIRSMCTDPKRVEWDHPLIAWLHFGDEPMSEDLGREVLRLVRGYYEAEAAKSQRSYDYFGVQLLEGLGRRLPTTLLGEAESILTPAPGETAWSETFQTPIAEMLETLRFRRDMIQELAR
jgi:hypothetical protein